MYLNEGTPASFVRVLVILIGMRLADKWGVSASARPQAESNSLASVGGGRVLDRLGLWTNLD